MEKYINIDKVVEIRLCLAIINEYNSKTNNKDNELNIKICEKELTNMNLQELKSIFKSIKDLIIKQEQNKALQTILDEIKEYGADWVKTKYGC